MEADGLFVYGNLREGGRDHRWLLRTDPEGLVRAFAPGRLFHLPAAGFPAMVPQETPTSSPPGPGWVTGEFVGYEDEDALEAALQDLDAVEDVEGGRFERIVLPVLLESGHAYLAWAYLFPPDRLARLTREGIELPSGNWKEFLAE
jgi:gamma-glutamylcyclotransferase (GGCT)/AIG2-like uncharacterized protein YtfP